MLGAGGGVGGLDGGGLTGRGRKQRKERLTEGRGPAPVSLDPWNAPSTCPLSPPHESLRTNQNSVWVSSNGPASRRMEPMQRSKRRGPWDMGRRIQGCLQRLSCFWVHLRGHGLVGSNVSSADFRCHLKFQMPGGFALPPCPARVLSEAAFWGRILMRSIRGPTPLRSPAVCSPMYIGPLLGIAPMDMPNPG